MRHEKGKEERRHETGLHRKKGWRAKVIKTEQSSKLDKELADEIEAIEKDFEMFN